ncbi:MAG: hypothetical protein QNJ62_00815 [Methyloceanibacter sp.]|nr:hypothetical protein [Methyloceanibacter sp.]
MRRQPSAKASTRITCLTEISEKSLVAGALGLSALLWLAIWAVI